MTPALARALIARGIIAVGTAVQITERGQSVDNCMIRRALARGKLICFEIGDPCGKIRVIDTEAIARVDGMEIDRLAAAQRLTAEGNAMLGERRGRPRREVRAPNLV